MRPERRVRAGVEGGRTPPPLHFRPVQERRYPHQIARRRKKAKKAAASASNGGEQGNRRKKGNPQVISNFGVCENHNHECQPSIPLQRILPVESDDRLLFPVLQPEVPGNSTVVLVGAAITLPPGIQFAGRYAQPADEPPDAELAGRRPAPDEVHDLVPRVVGNPDPGQSSPISFFSATCSAISSARTSSLVWIFFSR